MPVEPIPTPPADTLPGLLEWRAAATPQTPAYAERTTEGNWRFTTWAQHRRAVAALSQALAERGLAPGMRLLILANTSYAWERVQMAALGCGAVVVGVDPRSADAQLATIAQRVAPAALVAEDATQLQRLPPQTLSAARLVLQLRSGGENALSLATVEAQASEPSTESWSRAQPDDVACIVFTSGTTGEPKGIAYSHRQLCLACAALRATYAQLTAGDRFACWLPLANLFQRMVNHVAMQLGATTYFVEDPRQLLDRLPEIRPHLLIGVPRFFEKLHAGMQSRVDASGALRPLLRLAMQVGEASAAARRRGKTPDLLTRSLLAIVDPLILARFRRALGGEIRFLVSGSAPMPAWLLERLHGLGLTVLEAYGVSENLIPMAANRPQDFRFGTVGRPLPGNEVRLSAEGEVEVRGPCVFAGYLDDPDRSMFTADGFLKTGDEGEWTEDGFLRLKGRRSELFKLSTGRRVAPAAIEPLLAALPWVEQALVAGAGRPFVTALVAVNTQALAQWAQAHGLPSSLAEPPPTALAQALWQSIEAAVADLAPHERPAGVLLRLTPFSIEAGELTPNLKLRRRAILERHALDLDRLYDDIAAGAERLRVIA